MSDLKILYGYSWFESEAYGNVQELNLAYLKRLNEDDFDVEGFCLTLDPPGPCLTFKELDKRWRRGDRTLLRMYERLENKLEGKDVLINGPGINLHPEFVERLPVFTVFQCFDDPENSANLSRPVAAAYDLCLVGNIAEVDTYRAWGVKHAEWSPMGLQPTIYDPTLTHDDILSGERDIDLFMMIDRLSPCRKERLDNLAQAFPDAHFYGRGWTRGYLSNDKELAYLRRAKIGPNIHNSSGPINYRTFYLPANGVMQICDNKSHLGEIYELDKEVAGFDTIEECIDLCKYYLAHDEERRIIAANGWKRAVTDYNEIAVFNRLLDNIRKYISGDEKSRCPMLLINKDEPRLHMIKQLIDTLLEKIITLSLFIKKMIISDNNTALENNIGENLLEWPQRLVTALEMLKPFLKTDFARGILIADYGCGKQTLRQIIPSNWNYTPYDYRSRSADTIICNFNDNEMPIGSFDIIFCMGVLEYLEKPLALLLHAINSSSYVVFSYSFFTTKKRRKLQGWSNNLKRSEIEGFITANDACVLEKKHYKNNQWIYIIKRNNENGPLD